MGIAEKFLRRRVIVEGQGCLVGQYGENLAVRHTEVRMTDYETEYGRQTDTAKRVKRGRHRGAATPLLQELRNAITARTPVEVHAAAGPRRARRSA